MKRKKMKSELADKEMLKELIMDALMGFKDSERSKLREKSADKVKEMVTMKITAPKEELGEALDKARDIAEDIPDISKSIMESKGLMEKLKARDGGIKKASEQKDPKHSQKDTDDNASKGMKAARQSFMADKEKVKKVKK